MDGDVAPALLVPSEQREVRDPEEAARTGWNHLELGTEPEPQVRERVVDDRRPIRDEEDDVPGAQPGGRGEALPFGVGEELDDRRLPFVGADADPGETLGAVDTDEGRHVVEVLPRERRAV